MKQTRSSGRGQVLIILVFAILGLVAIVGLVIDGGNIYADRRHAQNAVDASVMAGALARNHWEKQYHAICHNFNTEQSLLPPCSYSTLVAARNSADENGYDGNLIDSTVHIYSPPKDGAYSVANCTGVCDPNDYIEVIITTNVDTFFIRVLGIHQLHNTVAAVALAQYVPESELYGGNSLVELGTGHGSCPSDFNVGGGGSVTLLGGGIWVNSSNASCAYKQTSCNTTIITEDGAKIQSVGGADVGGCNSPTIEAASPQYPYPPAHVFSPPAECGIPGSSSTSGGTTTYQPGSYGIFPTVNGPSILTPGVYCVDQLQTTKNIAGDGVLIYIRPATNKSQVDMSGGVISLSAPESGTYAGYLIYGDWDNNSTSRTCTIAGGTNSEYSGMIFVPYCELVISGNSSSSGNTAQVVAKTISLTGTMNLIFKYDSSEYPKIPEINRAGLFR